MNSDQQEMHEELQRSEKRYRMLFQRMQNGFALHEIICNEQGEPCDYRFLEVNPAFETLTGLRADDIIGKRVKEVLPAIEQHWIDRYGIVALTGISNHFENYSAELQRYYEVDVYSPQPGKFATVIADVTTRKESEEEFRLSVARFRTVLENAADAVFVANPLGRLVYANQKSCELVGFSRDELLVKSLFELVPPMLQEKAQFSFRRALKGKSVLTEASFVHSNGSHIPIDLNVVLLPDGNVYGSCRDISSRKLAEKKLQALEKQFQQTQKLESLGALAGGIAHDFNNILTIILGHCFMSKEEADSGIADNDHVQQIEVAANRAADLCRQMLAYAGNSPLLNVQLDLRQLVDETVSMLRSAIKKNVTINRDLKRDVPEIPGDNAQIQQVVMNLIINAAEAIGDRYGTIRVALEKTIIQRESSETDVMGAAIPAGKYACLEVSDTGCGIDEETEKRIFEPFFTTKFTGRGLGMSAVLGIIKSHDGALQLISTPGTGTIFKAYFPAPDTIDTVETTQPEWNLPSIRANCTILLVDDEESLRAIGSALLNAMGYSAIAAANGREALEICREQESGIDLILLDMVMPEMGGVDTYHELRKMKPDVPIIFCSGYGIEGILDDFDTDRYVDAIQKPYKPDQLRSTMLNLLEKTERHS